MKTLHSQKSKAQIYRFGDMFKNRDGAMVNNTMCNMPSRKSTIDNDYWLNKYQLQPYKYQWESGNTSENLDAEANSNTKEQFRDIMSKTLSLAYCLFIITFGLTVYLADLLFIGGKSDFSYPEVFCIFLLVPGILYFLFLYMDIKAYLKKFFSMTVSKNKLESFESKNSNITIASSKITENFQSMYTLPRVTLYQPEQFQQQFNPHPYKNSSTSNSLNGNEIPHYFFIKHVHAKEFYFKIGIGGFCMGHLLHSSLLLSFEIVIFFEESATYQMCTRPINLFLDLLYPLYSFVIMFFIFKYSNVVINKYKEFARFAIMHCIATNLSFWLWTIVRELTESMNSRNVVHRIQATTFRALPLPIYYSTDIYNSDEHTCHEHTKSSKLFEMFTPYLCPFTIEYSIILVAVLYNLWSNIGKYNEDVNLSPTLFVQNNTQNSVENNSKENIELKEFNSSNKGLFAGFIVLVGSFLSIILFFVAVAAESPISVTVNAVSELLILLLMTVVVILAFKQTVKMNYKKREIMLDCVLLFIPLPALFVEAILSISSVISQNLWQIATIATIVKIIQVMLQTPFIVDGLQRWCNNRHQRHQNPGRELILLLLICNISLWILDVFEMKCEYTSGDLRSEYFGFVFWAIMGDLSSPLVMFYRFHSSICLAEIWKHTYE